MPIPRYGVWKGTPTEWNGRAKPDHGHITFTDGNENNLDAAVNVESSSKDTRLVYWMLRDFDGSHPIAQQLATLDPGFYAQHGEGSLGLDFLRGNFLDIKAGILVSHDAPGAGHDVLDYLDPILNQAVSSQATIYIYGSKYDGHDGQDGIHDIHMNQGNMGHWMRDNGAFQDGGIILQFSDGHWEGVFFAFAVQAYETDKRGDPLSRNSPTFAMLMTGEVDNGEDEAAPAPTNGDSAPTNGDSAPTNGDSAPTNGDSEYFDISIQAALVNPVGPDEEVGGESVFLQNRWTTDISLDGWTVSNAAGDVQVLPSGATIASHSKEKFLVPDCPLSNRGGTITLKNPNGEVMDQVSYTKEQAKREGILVYFEQKVRSRRHRHERK